MLTFLIHLPNDLFFLRILLKRTYHVSHRSGAENTHSQISNYDTSQSPRRASKMSRRVVHDFDRSGVLMTRHPQLLGDRLVINPTVHFAYLAERQLVHGPRVQPKDHLLFRDQRLSRFLGRLRRSLQGTHVVRAQLVDVRHCTRLKYLKKV